MRRPLTLKQKDARFAIMACTPMFLYIAVVLLVPVIWGVSLSFTNKRIGGEGAFIGLENFRQLFADRQFGNAAKNTAIYTLITIFGKNLFGLFMALALNHKFKGNNIARALMIIPWTLPNIVAVLNWRWIFSDIGGAANAILKSLNLIQRDYIWLGDRTLAFVAILTANIWRGTPFFGVSILARLQTISEDLYEAASIDGANTFQKFLYITLPAIRDTILLTTLVSTIWTINEFESVWLLTGGGPSGATEVLGVYSYRNAMVNMQLGKGVAVSVSIMPILIVLIFAISNLMLKTDSE